MSVRRLALPALLASVLGACLGGVLPKAEQRAIYALLEAAPMRAAAQWKQPLQLAPLQAVPPRSGGDVLVLLASGEFQLLPGVRWAAPLPALLQELLARQIETAGLASAVVQANASLAAPLRLHAELLAFELHDGRGELRAQAGLRLSLVCVRDGHLLAASEPIRTESEPVPREPAAATAALREAASRLARDAVLWLAKAEISGCT